MPNVFIQDPTLPQGFSISFRERFWAKVNKAGPVQSHCSDLGQCWIWTARIGTHGYGEIQRGRRGEGVINAHVASWLIHFGFIAPSLKVLHRCDFKPCVRPNHLWLGTDADNNHDMRNKGRDNTAQGEDAGAAKLTLAEVHEIRSLFQSGHTNCAALGRSFGLHRTQIWRIVHNRYWRVDPG